MCEKVSIMHRGCGIEKDIPVQSADLTAHDLLFALLVGLNHLYDFGVVDLYMDSHDELPLKAFSL